MKHVLGVLGFVASKVRHEVVQLPESIQQAVNLNARKLKVCAFDLPDIVQEGMLNMFNSDWGETYTGSLSHYCVPGCCASQRHTQQKAKDLLSIFLGRFFDVPLLYKWKHFQPSVVYCCRGMLVHQLLRFVWDISFTDKLDDGALDLAVLDEDLPDMQPAQRQKIRGAKVSVLLGEVGIIPKLVKGVVLTQPLTDFMDLLSMIETQRIRARLRADGILPPTSKCSDLTDADLVDLNLQVATGDAGWEVIQAYYDMLQVPGHLQWPCELGLQVSDCLDLIVTTMCDAFRRLVTPFAVFPWVLFRAIKMEPLEGLCYFRQVGLNAGPCILCQDRFFAKAHCNAAYVSSHINII